MLIKRNILLLVPLLTMLCVGCGQKGSLYLPEKKTKPVAESAALNPELEQEPVYASQIH